MKRINQPTKWPASQCSPGCPGWAVFNGNEIQRCDACQRFADDDEAIEHVLKVERREIENTLANVRWEEHDNNNKEKSE